MLFRRWLVAALLVFALVGAGGQSDHYAPRFLREPTYTIAKKNRSLTLSCLTDGLPKPLVEWYRDGERVIVDSRRYILDSGALYFRKVINERGNKPDVGFYHCIARNSQGAIASRRVSVTVAALSKRFSEQPGNTSVWQGDNVRFSCQSEKSIPPATITWEKDGVPIVHSNDKITLLPGVLQITNARTADEGRYRCILSNGIKQRYSQEGFLKVLSGVPTKNDRPVIVAPSVNVTVTKGEDAVLECVTSGLPLPMLSWKRLVQKQEVFLDVPKQSSKVGTFNWRITAATENDEGEYRCTATSEGKMLTASVWLFVKDPPHFVTEPGDKKVRYGHPVKLLCSAKGSPAPKLTWLKNSKPIQDTDKIYVISEGSGRNLLIPRTTLEDNGQYQCFAENELGSIQSTGSLETIIAVDQPGPPQAVVASVKSSSSVLLSWSPPLGSFNITAYTICYRDLDHQDETELQRVVDKEMDKYTLDNLFGFTNYSFFVVAYTNSVGLPSKTVVVQTLSAKPSGIPLHLSVTSNTSDSLDVKWESPPAKHVNGLLTQYVIQYKHDGASGGFITHRIPASKQQYRITGLTKGATYAVQVAAATKAGDGPFCLEVKGKVQSTSNPEQPGPKCLYSAPERMACSSESPDTLRVTWEKPVAVKDVNYFEVSYGVRGSQAMDTQQVSTENITLKNLHAGIEYTISVQCRYKRDDLCLFMKPAVRNCKTTETEARSAPSNIKIEFVSPDAVDVSWGRPQQANGIIKKYEVLYSENRNLPLKQWKKVEITKFVAIRITFKRRLAGLSPNATYYVGIRSVSDHGNGPLSRVHTTPLSWSTLVKNSAPKFTVRHTSLTTVDVSWSIQANIKGKLEGYTVIFSSDPKIPKDEWKKKTIKINWFLEKEKKLTEQLELMPNKIYQVLVRAEFMYNLSGPWSAKEVSKVSSSPTTSIKGRPSVNEPNGVDPKTEGERSSDEDDDFAVKLGIIIGCIISAFFTVVLILFIIWRNPCRQRKSTQAIKTKNAQSMNSFVPNVTSFQMSVSASQGQSSSYEEASVSSAMCQCRCTCGGRRPLGVTMLKAASQTAISGNVPSANGHVFHSNMQQGKNTSVLKGHALKHSKDSGHTSSSSLFAEVSVEGQARTTSASRSRKQSVSVDV